MAAPTPLQNYQDRLAAMPPAERLAQAESWARTATSYCQLVMEKRAELAAMKAEGRSVGYRRNSSRSLGRWQSHVVGLARDVEQALAAAAADPFTATGYTVRDVPGGVELLSPAGVVLGQFVAHATARAVAIRRHRDGVDR